MGILSKIGGFVSKAATTVGGGIATAGKYVGNYVVEKATKAGEGAYGLATNGAGALVDTAMTAYVTVGGKDPRRDEHGNRRITSFSDGIVQLCDRCVGQVNNLRHMASGLPIVGSVFTYSLDATAGQSTAIAGTNKDSQAGVQFKGGATYKFTKGATDTAIGAVTGDRERVTEGMDNAKKNAVEHTINSLNFVLSFVGAAGSAKEMGAKELAMKGAKSLAEATYKEAGWKTVRDSVNATLGIKGDVDTSVAGKLASDVVQGTTSTISQLASSAGEVLNLGHIMKKFGLGAVVQSSSTAGVGGLGRQTTQATEKQAEEVHI